MIVTRGNQPGTLKHGETDEKKDSDKNLLLRQTRDLLLPRLISGKLSVEHLLDEEENLTMAAEPELAYGKN